MKLNVLFVTLALCSSSTCILAAPLPQPGVGGAFKKAFSSVFESSASKEIKNAPYYSEEYVAQPGFEQYGNHAQKPGGLDKKKSKGRKKGWSSESSSSSTPPPTFSGGSHAEESPRRSDASRELSPRPMSPPPAQPRLPGGLQLPYHHPLPLAAAEQPYVGMHHSGPPPTYNHGYQALAPPYHYPQAPQGGYATHQQLDWIGGYHPQPGYAHPSQSYGEHGGSYRSMLYDPGHPAIYSHLPPPAPEAAQPVTSGGGKGRVFPYDYAARRNERNERQRKSNSVDEGKLREMADEAVQGDTRVQGKRRKGIVRHPSMNDLQWNDEFASVALSRALLNDPTNSLTRHADDRIAVHVPTSVHDTMPPSKTPKSGGVNQLELR
ncbi:hypothetical protein PHSY_002670 [Pseudozyma hubeiensis SY62]|uniref:Uncharacterized protein n=1 Tax=Pseudozyma hubeiensis (strain SY62) TaxID=1305764 RepID=R9PAG4_PSEHS|nr:hypothetical protein PHSY_002670 [Pseudozyma hubeiensis SY62]GAC95095.1 hypothetical protein PHSY_002670 [Pseudozyma hubeiensis SY62]